MGFPDLAARLSAPPKMGANVKYLMRLEGEILGGVCQ